MRMKVMTLLIITGFMLFSFNLAAAEDPAPGEETQAGTQEESAFKNATEAQRAMNLAEAYAAKPDPELEKAIEDANKAQKELEEAITSGDEVRIKEARQALESAQKNADEKLAEDADVTAEEIGEMRRDGMGWGEIAHELGLHPGVLGMGHTYRNRNRVGDEGETLKGNGLSERELQAATQRNFKSGFSKGHGVQEDKGNQGNSSDKEEKKNSKALEKGEDKSNGGGNGKGNGKK